MSDLSAIQKVRGQRAALVKQIDALTHQLRGVDMALSAMGDVAVSAYPATSARGRRGLLVKQRILDYLTDAGERGANATTIVALSERQGSPLERATVSSLLSRLKHNGVVTYDGRVYRIVAKQVAAANNTSRAEQSA